jgi:hypothetical protein
VFGRGKGADGVRVGAIPRAVGPYRQQLLDDRLSTRDTAECRVGHVLQLDDIERDRCVWQPQRRAEQRCSFDSGGFRVVAGRGDGEFIPVLAKVVPDA